MKKKTFDCVAMKWRAQEELSARMGALDPSQRNALLQQAFKELQERQAALRAKKEKPQ